MVFALSMTLYICALLLIMTVFNTFRCQRQLNAFPNDADSGETAYNELSLLKSALFAT